MERRILGKTGLELSIIGFGGFHLIETPLKECKNMLNYYLDNGGNYIETAADYGDGISEKKIGMAVSHRRQEFILASKCARRTKTETQKSIERSLNNLKTEYLDILFMHGVQSKDEANRIHGTDGAMEAAVNAQKEGKVRYVAISGHGEPEALTYAINQASYDVLMTGFNYFDRFNFPATENELLPECTSKGIGILGMKALADGYLYQSWRAGIRYALSLPITSLVLGINTMEYLKNDLSLANHFFPMSNEEKEKLYSEAPELGNYVCRQCKK
ncbi:MAG: aldo/keto reductase, partial [Prolixibacteraceae bacterium]|nr:aldo/keto reductase [Prolixibacteraceae bacterium]